MKHTTRTLTVDEDMMRGIVALVVLHGLMQSVTHRETPAVAVDHAFDVADAYVDALAYYRQRTARAEQEGDA